MTRPHALYSAAATLCAYGASSGAPAGFRRAVFAYNQSAAHVTDVLSRAAQRTIPARSRPIRHQVPSLRRRAVGRMWREIVATQISPGKLLCPLLGAVLVRDRGSQRGMRLVNLLRTCPLCGQACHATKDAAPSDIKFRFWLFHD